MPASPMVFLISKARLARPSLLLGALGSIAGGARLPYPKLPHHRAALERIIGVCYIIVWGG